MDSFARVFQVSAQEGGAQVLDHPYSWASTLNVVVVVVVVVASICATS